MCQKLFVKQVKHPEKEHGFKYNNSTAPTEAATQIQAKSEAAAVK